MCKNPKFYVQGNLFKFLVGFCFRLANISYKLARDWKNFRSIFYPADFSAPILPSASNIWWTFIVFWFADSRAGHPNLRYTQPYSQPHDVPTGAAGFPSQGMSSGLDARMNICMCGYTRTHGHKYAPTCMHPYVHVCMCICTVAHTQHTHA